MTFGNSGSSILTTDRKSLGVNSHAFVNHTTGESTVSGACLMHRWMYDSVYEASGRGSNLPSCESAPECPCGSISFLPFPLVVQDPELSYLLLK
jgi:hypothetical protein